MNKTFLTAIAYLVSPQKVDAFSPTTTKNALKNLARTTELGESKVETIKKAAVASALSFSLLFAPVFPALADGM